MGSHDKGRRSRPPAVGMGRKLLQFGVSMWIVLHFTALFAAASTTGETSDLLAALWRVFQPYLQTLYLNHGYGFFAPEPAPSHLLEYEAVRSDGTTIKGRIPPVEGLHPRLLYHRTLLLTEHLTQAPSDRIEDWYRSYARHLCHKLGALRVRLTRVVHYPPSPSLVRNGYATDDPITYERFYLGEFPCQD